MKIEDIYFLQHLLLSKIIFSQYYKRVIHANFTSALLHKFIVKIFTVIYAENHKILNNSLGIKTDKILLEQIWQKEFRELVFK